VLTEMAAVSYTEHQRGQSFSSCVLARLGRSASRRAFVEGTGDPRNLRLTLFKINKQTGVNVQYQNRHGVPYVSSLLCSGDNNTYFLSL
jgi:hypothetical protein